MKKEFICMEETVDVTKELINNWVKDGYTIDIVAQSILMTGRTTTWVTTSLWRWK